MDPVEISQSSRSRLATASLVLGLLALILGAVIGVVGLVLGAIALVQINGSKGRITGRSMAVAGIVVSVLFTTLRAAVLTPAYIEARQIRQRQNCASNLRQIGLAIRLYLDDYGDHYPLVDWQKGMSLRNGYRSQWAYVLEPYTKDSRAFQCPSLKRTRKTEANVDYLVPCYSGRRENLWLFGCRDGKDEPHSLPARNSQVPFPERTIVVYESGTDEIRGQCWGYFTSEWMGEDPAAPAPHADGCNFCLADGHVQWYRTLGPVGGVSGWPVGPGPGRYYDLLAHKISVRRDYVPSETHFYFPPRR